MKKSRRGKRYSNEYFGTMTQMVVLSVAIVASLFLHCLGIIVIRNIQIPLFDNVILSLFEKPQKDYHKINVDIKKSQELIDAENLQIVEAFSAEQTEEYTDTPQPAPETIFEPKNIASRFLPGTGDKTVDFADVDMMPSPDLWLPRVEIVEIDRKKVESVDLADMTRIVIPNIERQEIAPDVVFQAPRVKIEEKDFTDFPAFIPSAAPARGVGKLAEYIEGTKAAAVTPTPVSPEAIANPTTTSEIIDKVIEVPEPTKEMTPIEDVLTPQITVYKPGFFSSDEYLYFRIDVSRKDESSLPVIKRDVLFIQDASESIGPLRIGLVRDNLKKLVSALEPSDRFNIVAFNDESSLCFPHSWMSASEEGGKIMAEKFIDGIEAKGSTDIYSAIEEILDLPMDPNRVLIVILLTDGSSTTGAITEDTKIISEFSKMNGGKASVFSISPGRKGNNDYLLSMLSFLNRGGSAIIAKDRFKANDASMNVFSSTSRPVLADISFMFDSLSNAEVAPRNTPHLYLDKPLYIYGRVQKDVESVTFHAKGSSYGKNYDMIFELELDSPGVKSGDSSIREAWARARMFDLFVEYEKTKSPILAQEMRNLSKQYDIAIPFEERVK